MLAIRASLRNFARITRNPEATRLLPVCRLLAKNKVRASTKPFGQFSAFACRSSGSNLEAVTDSPGNFTRLFHASGHRLHFASFFKSQQSFSLFSDFHSQSATEPVENFRLPKTRLWLMTCIVLLMSLGLSGWILWATCVR